MEKLTEYWHTNIQGNIKKISATFGSMITTLIGLLLYGIKSNLDWTTILITIVFSLQPFFNIWINIIFKGETTLKDNELIYVKQQLEYQRELSEYQIQLASLKANKNWNDANNGIAAVETKIHNIQ